MASIKILSISQTEEWNNIVCSFENHDVYYLNGYVKAFQIHGDGEPILIYYNSEDLKGIGVFIKRDISELEIFKDILPKNTYFDMTSPYGYGGFLFEGKMSKSSLDIFDRHYVEVLEEENIICEFVRYHPILRNADNMREISTIIDLGETIEMDISSETIIWNNIASKNRNVIRKAQKNGIQIFHKKSLEILQEFRFIYNQTMERDNADPYYYFDEAFYESIHNDLYDNYELFYAMYDDKMIAASIILYANKKIHYHLSGSLVEYRSLAPTNLLLCQVAYWGCKHGFTSFHLGGGLGSSEDSLYKFKQAFNKNSNTKFSIGKRILNNEMYSELINKRKEIGCFNENSSYFPLYRAK